MKRIISIFLLLSAFAVCGADYVSHPDSESRFALNRLIRYVKENFRASGSRDVNIISEDRVPPGEPRCEVKQNQYTIYINPMDDFRRDESFCLRLICMLLKAKSGSSAKNLAELPDWFICGMTQVVVEQTRGAMIVRNQHTFTLLDTLAENGCFGNPADILDVKANQLSGAEKMFFAEYAKLVMLVLDKEKGFSRLTEIIGEDSEIDRKKFNEAARQSLKSFDREFISSGYRRIMWGELVPPPEKFTEKCLDKAVVVDVPELGKDRLPTGKVMQIPLADLQTLAERDDFLFICRRVVFRLYTVSAGESRQVQQLVAGLRYLVESELNYQANRRRSAGHSEKSAVPGGKKQVKNGMAVISGNKKNSKLPKNKTANSTVKKLDADEKFNQLMSNSSDSNFKNSIREFYQNNLLDKKSDGYGKNTGAFGRMFPTGSKFSSKAVSRYISDIKSALADRAELRAYLDKEIFNKIPVHEKIRFRRETIYGQSENSQAAWLERINKELY